MTKDEFEILKEILERDRVSSYCGDCRYFDDAGYENEEEEYIYRIGYCHFWGQDTQACGFCHHGTKAEKSAVKQ